MDQPAPSRRDVGVTPWIFLQATLPHNLPKGADGTPAPAYVARNGTFTLKIRSGIDDEGRPVGVPSGGLARYVLAHIATRVRKTGDRIVDLGASRREMLRRLKMEQGGDHKKRLQLQMTRLATAVITFERRTRQGQVVKLSGANVPIADDYQLWWTEGAEDDAEFFIVLSERFAAELERSAIPVDMEKLLGLRHSPLAMDDYTWLTYKRAERERAPRLKSLVVSWSDLHGQFGSGYGSTKEFARRSKPALKAVSALWPELAYEVLRGRLHVLDGPPDVARRAPR